MGFGVAFAGVLLFFSSVAWAQSTVPYGRPLVGAYYFDGWHKEKTLSPFMPSERMPPWGWYDNTQAIMDRQINLASSYSINFFAFDWYYPDSRANKTDPKNNALKFFLASPRRNKMQFCLMVANHQGYTIKTLADWDAAAEVWASHMVQPNYLKLGGKPLFIVFDPDQLVKAATSADLVKTWFARLNAKVSLKSKGAIREVAFAACAYPGDIVYLTNLEKAGYTIATGYNFHVDKKQPTGGSPFTRLSEILLEISTSFIAVSKIQFAPVATLGWDPRPDVKIRPSMYPNGENSMRYYVGKTPALMEASVRSAKQWMAKNPTKTTPQKLMLLYAWNEYIEGGWLTPTSQDGQSYLAAVKRGIKY